MLGRDELAKVGPVGFNLYQREKDYVQYWVLDFFSKFGKEAIFKGGTCLQKLYGLPRYSEDLDFTLAESLKIDWDELKRFLEGGGFSNVSISFLKSTPLGDSVKIQLNGPLFVGKPASRAALLLE